VQRAPLRVSEEVDLLQAALLAEMPPIPLEVKLDRVDALLRASREAHGRALRVYRERHAMWTAGFEAAVGEGLERLRRATGRHAIPHDEAWALRQALRAREPPAPRLVALLPYERLEAVVRATLRSVRVHGGGGTAAMDDFLLTPRPS
jgi:hypothetical protein